jgi:hypothetical protein
MTQSVQWAEMSAREVAELALVLIRQPGASIKQYPAFNERFRRSISKPTYLKCLDETGKTKGIVGVITLGLPGVKCGAVIDGPVMFDETGCPAEAAQALAAWFRSRGYAFIRLTHADEARLQTFARMPEAVFENPLPFVARFGGECVVHLKADDSEMLAGFQQIARKEIRMARDMSCRIGRTSEVREFRKVWPDFLKQSKEKGFRYRRLRDYEAMFALSPREDLLRLYTAGYDGKIVFQVVFLRDGVEAYGLIGALNRDALGGKPSPSCLVHWTAMREYRDLGCERYNLGLPTGAVYASKRKFRPSKTPSPFTVTLVLRPHHYSVWSRLILPSTRVAFRAARLLRGG